MSNSTTMAIACDLNAIPAEQRVGHTALTEQLFRKLAIESQELPNGFAWRFDANVYALVAAFVNAERRCCPFLSIGLEVMPGDGGLWLRLTGPEGAKDFLAATFVK